MKAVDRWEYEGKEVKSIWLPKKNFEEISPITQVYGVVFNKDNEILIARSDDEWIIPGGTPEEDDNSLIATLKRELWEEVRVKIKNQWPIGYCKVLYPAGEEEPDVSYQVRYACLVDEIHEIGPDPDTGKIFERKFIGPEEFTKYVEWGEMGREMIKEAVETIEKE